MLPADLLKALDGLPPEEALRRPVEAGGNAANRIEALLGGNGGAPEPLTVRDMLFRWARTEPASLDEADIPEVRTVSAILAATGRLPRRLGMLTDLQGMAKGLTQRSYLLSRFAAHLCDGQGYEACIQSNGDDPIDLVVNGLDFAVQDPDESPPTVLERLTFMAQDVAGQANDLIGSPLAFALPGVTGDVLSRLLPSFGMAQGSLTEVLNLCSYAHTSAQGVGILLRKDWNAILRLGSMTSSVAAGHMGQLAGHAAVAALLGVTGSWVLVLAPIAGGFAGRVAGRNLARRARYRLFCSAEVAAVRTAISRHCRASEEVLKANIAAARVRQERFMGLHTQAEGPAKVVVADWLDRLEGIQSYRKLAASRLDRAAGEPLILDRRDGDILTAAQESLLLGARTGVHPANVSQTAGQLAAACTALHRKMSHALV